MNGGLANGAVSTAVRLMVLLVTILSCVGCDQLTKSMARTELVPGHTLSLLNDVFRLQYAENSGAFLSLGDSLPKTTRHTLFTVGAVILVAVAMCWTLFSARLRILGIVGAALICAGGVGNLIDRISRDGYVTDFLNVGIGTFRTGIFNVADFILLSGLVLALYDGMTDRR